MGVDSTARDGGAAGKSQWWRAGRAAIWAISGSVVTVAVMSAALAFAQPGEDGVIDACIRTSNGAVRIGDGPQDCRRDETYLSWNQQGLRGEVGAIGPQGPPGVTGSAAATEATLGSLGPSLGRGLGAAGGCVSNFNFVVGCNGNEALATDLGYRIDPSQYPPGAIFTLNVFASTSTGFRFPQPTPENMTPGPIPTPAASQVCVRLWDPVAGQPVTGSESCTDFAGADSYETSGVAGLPITHQHVRIESGSITLPQVARDYALQARVITPGDPLQSPNSNVETTIHVDW